MRGITFILDSVKTHCRDVSILLGVENYNLATGLGPSGAEDDIIIGIKKDTIGYFGRNGCIYHDIEHPITTTETLKD